MSAKQCPNCEGAGKVSVTPAGLAGKFAEMRDCVRCDGAGSLPVCETCEEEISVEGEHKCSRRHNYLLSVESGDNVVMLRRDWMGNEHFILNGHVLDAHEPRITLDGGYAHVSFKLALPRLRRPVPSGGETR